MATFDRFSPPPVSPEFCAARAKTNVIVPPAPPMDAPPPPPVKAGAGKSVLLVDDDRAWLTTLTRVLEREGFKVSTATNAPSALKSLKETPVDLIVADLNMPRMDGLEFRDALNADAACATIPFIFVSGSLDRENREAARGLGVATFLEKTGPINELTSLASNLAATSP